MADSKRTPKGLALIWILLLIALALIVIWLVFRAWGAEDFTKQSVSSVEVTGPPTMTPGTPTTFQVKLTLGGPIHPRNAFRVNVAIYEYDIADVRLIRSIPIRFPGGATTGTATFTLTCEDHGAERWIVGADGHNTYDDVWEVFGSVPDQQTAYYDYGSNHNVSCPKGG
jgi:hypothetical protein